MKDRDICPEKAKGRFNILNAIFLMILIISSFAIGNYLYFIWALAAQGLGFYVSYASLMDGSTPPYIAIFSFGSFFLAVLGLIHLRKLRSDLC